MLSESLEEYMLTGKLLIQSLKYKMGNNTTNTDTPYKKKTTVPITVTTINTPAIIETIFSPSQKDSLFWCFYVIKHGFSAYEMLQGTHYSAEKKEKINYVNVLREQKSLLKLHKISPLSEIEDDLVNKERIGIKVVLALALIEGLNVMYIDNRKCYEQQHNDSDVVHVIHKVENSYRYEHTITADKLNEYRNTLFKWENIHKPIKAIASYKVGELTEMCTKLGVTLTSDKKKSKKDLYELVVQYVGTPL